MQKLIPILFFCLALATTPVAAQQCDDFEGCTANDLCSAGMCTGTPINGGGCDDSNPCTINDTCASGRCQGSPAPNGTACGNGCGQCVQGACTTDLAKIGQPCDDDFACTDNDLCLPGGICFGQYRICPDTDDDVCTLDFCNPISGQCEALGVPPCPPCQACIDAGDGNFDCEAGPNGGTCDDFNECTGNGTCQAGECQSGPPVTPGSATSTPTRSATPAQPTSTPAVPTATSVPPTSTAVPPTATRVPPTATAVPATATAVPPTATSVPPTSTAIPPTATRVPPTSTPVGNTPTVQPTSTAPAATPTTVPACIGDCGGDGEVTVDEIVTAVNIALGNNSINDCNAADANNDGAVTVEEIIRSVNNALNGCG